jgi:hypothetical protein
MHVKKVFVGLKRKKQACNLRVLVDFKRIKCVAYPQEDFQFIKLITSFRISLLNNCKKDFQFHSKTTGRIFYYTKYRIFFYTTYLNFTFLGSHDSRLHFRPHKVYFFELGINVLIDG